MAMDSCHGTDAHTFVFLEPWWQFHHDVWCLCKPEGRCFHKFTTLGFSPSCVVLDSQNSRICSMLGSWMHGLQEVVAVSGRKCLKIDFKKGGECHRRLSLQDFLQGLCFETWDTTSGHIKRKIGVFDGGKRFRSSLCFPCGATLCTSRSGPTSKQWNGRLAKPLENTTQNDTCINLARFCPRGFLFSKTPELTTFLGGGTQFVGGGGWTRYHPAGSWNQWKTRPNMTRATIWPTSAQDLGFRGGFC